MPFLRKLQALAFALVLGILAPGPMNSEPNPSQDREPAFRDNLYDVAIRDDFAWIVGYYGTILRSGDRGTTWELQPSGTTEALFRIVLHGQKSGWISGSYGT